MDRKLGLILSIAAFLLIMLIPAEITFEARLAVAVTALVILLWCFQPIPFGAASLIPIAVFPAAGILSYTQLAEYYANPIVFLFMGGLMITAAIQRWNLHKRIALHIVKFTGTSPQRIILGFMAASAFLSMWIANTAVAIMLIPAGVAIAQSFLGDKDLASMTPEEKKFVGCLVLAIAYSAIIGGFGTPIGNPINGVALSQFTGFFPNAPAIDFFTWMKFGVPFVIMMTAAAWIWLIGINFGNIPKVIDNSDRKLKEELNALGPMSRGEKNTLIVFLIAVFLWVFGKTKDIGGFVIPGLDMIIPGINDSSAAIFCALLLFILPVSFRKRIFTLDWNTAVKIPWDILLFIGAGLAISAAFMTTGVAAALSTAFAGLFFVHPVLIILIISLTAALIGEVCSNLSVVCMMLTLILPISCSALGMNPIYMLFAVAIGGTLSFALPFASPIHALAYGTGYPDIKNMLKCGLFIDIYGCLLLTVIVIAFGGYIFGMDMSIPLWAV